MCKVARMHWSLSEKIGISSSLKCDLSRARCSTGSIEVWRSKAIFCQKYVVKKCWVALSDPTGLLLIQTHLHI